MKATCLALITTILISNLAVSQTCEDRRFMVEETNEYFQIEPGFKFGEDSLLTLIHAALSKKVLILNDSERREVLVILDISKNGVVLSFESLIDEQFEYLINNELEFLLHLKNSWCPGYYYLKRKQIKETRRSSDLAINLIIENGHFISSKIIR